MVPALPDRSALAPARDAARAATGLQLNPPISGLEIRVISYMGNPKMTRKKACYFQPLHGPQAPTYPCCSPHLHVHPVSQQVCVLAARQLRCDRVCSWQAHPTRAACPGTPPSLHSSPLPTVNKHRGFSNYISLSDIFLLSSIKCIFPLRYHAGITAAAGPDMVQNSLRQLFCEERNSVLCF